MELKRDVLDTMIAWKTKRNRKPMLLQGARQVGKTWLLKKLGKQVFDNCVIVNIDREPVIADILEHVPENMKLRLIGYARQD